MIKNKKSLPLDLNLPIILFVESSHGETIYIVNPIKKKFTFLYTTEESIHSDAITKKELTRFISSINNWNSIVRRKLTQSNNGKILHWEYI